MVCKCANTEVQILRLKLFRQILRDPLRSSEIKVTVICENKKNLKIFAVKVDSVQFTFGKPYQDNTKKDLHEIKRKENDACVSVSSDEEPED